MKGLFWESSPIQYSNYDDIKIITLRTKVSDYYTSRAWNDVLSLTIIGGKWYFENFMKK